MVNVLLIIAVHLIKKHAVNVVLDLIMLTEFVSQGVLYLMHKMFV